MSPAGRRLCAHADEDGRGMHFLEPGERCDRLRPGDPIPPEQTGGMAGFVVGECGHRVAGSEWRVGFRNCERCGSLNATCTCAITGRKCPRPEHSGYVSADSWRWDHGVGPSPHTWQTHDTSDDKTGDQS